MFHKSFTDYRNELQKQTECVAQDFDIRKTEKKIRKVLQTEAEDLEYVQLEVLRDTLYNMQFAMYKKEMRKRIDEIIEEYQNNWISEIELSNRITKERALFDSLTDKLEDFLLNDHTVDTDN